MPSETLEQAVKKFTKIINQALPSHEMGKRIALAVSGGADSMCMSFLAQKAGLNLVCLIVNHKLRREADAEAIETFRFLQNQCLSVEILDWHQKGATLKPMSNLQHKARNARYKLMLDYCKQHNISYLLTAHTKNDVAETVLIRIERGSGIDGISAIPFKKDLDNVTLLRPMLSFLRREIISILEAANWQWINDPSNENTYFARNRIRKFLAEQPDTELWFNRLSLLADNASRCRSFLEQEMLRHIQAICTISDFGYVSLNKLKFLQLHEEMQLRILSHLLKAIGGMEYTCKLTKLKTLNKIIAEGEKSYALMKCEIIQNRNSELVLLIKERSLIEAIPLDNNNLSFIWDARFEIKINNQNSTTLNELYIAPTSTYGWHHIKKENNCREPYKAILTTPALFRADQYLANLSLGAYKDPISNLEIYAKSVLQNKILG